MSNENTNQMTHNPYGQQPQGYPESAPSNQQPQYNQGPQAPQGNQQPVNFSNCYQPSNPQQSPYPGTWEQGQQYANQYSSGQSAGSPMFPGPPVTSPASGGVVSPNSSFAGAPLRAGNGSMGNPTLQMQQVQQRSPQQQPQMHGMGSGPVSPMSGSQGGPRIPQGGSTRVCRHFVQGKCTWGDGCRFLHDVSKISESNPPLSPPGPPLGVGNSGMPPPIQVGQGLGVLSVGSNPTVGNGMYSNPQCLPPALAIGNGSRHSTPMQRALGSGPVSPMNNGSFGPQDLMPNVVLRSRSDSLLKSPPSTSQPGSRPLSPGAVYAHSPYGDQHLPPTSGNLEPGQNWN